jgi:tetratricopeptide (TPR) repeat protein
MKKYHALIFLFLICTALSHAQLKTDHYEIIADGKGANKNNVADTAYARDMEQLFSLFNGVFCFDPKALTAPLRVRVFSDRDEYNAYITARLGGEKPGAVYLQYGNPAKNELVIHQESQEESQLVPHQAFIQFIRAYIPSPPLWLREGFAAYFTALSNENEKTMDWLVIAKKAAIKAENILTETGQKPVLDSPFSFSILSWSVVSFFMDDKLSPRYRALTDSFTVLDPPASVEDNTRAMLVRLTRFAAMEEINRGYTKYIADRKTFVDIVEEGQKAYNSRNLNAAAALFRQAKDIKPDHYAPYYYLGLIAYEEKNYTEAEESFRDAAVFGALIPQVQYARGVNAAAAGKKDDAKSYLEEAAALDSQYKSRYENFIKHF